MKQGDIWDIDLNPTEGSEQHGVRPCVILSGNTMNDNFNLVIVCPLTSKVKNYMGNVVLAPSAENGLTQQSEILVFNIRTVAKKRAVKHRGNINADQLTQIKSNLIDIITF